MTADPAARVAAIRERKIDIDRTFRQHFEEGGQCDGVCEVEAHAWVRTLLDDNVTLLAEVKRLQDFLDDRVGRESP